MAQIVYYNAKTFGHLTSSATNIPYVAQSVVDFSKILTKKGSALSQGDVIKVFTIPRESIVAYATVKVLEAADSTSLLVDLGTGTYPSDYVSGLNAKTLGWASDKNSTSTFTIFPSSDTIDLTLSTLSGTLTKGKLVVSVMMFSLFTPGLSNSTGSTPISGGNILYNGDNLVYDGDQLLFNTF